MSSDQSEITLPTGKTIWFEDNKAGGVTWYSDEVGSGVIVWDTSLVNLETLLSVITHEHYRRLNGKSKY